MRVLTEDIEKLFKKAIEKFEKECAISFGQINNVDFFKQFTDFINVKTKSDLSANTIYKQFYIRLKNYSLPEIGYSVNYLNAFCLLVENAEYTQVFSMIMDGGNEMPEFPYPPFIPCFPATPAVPIKVTGFNNVWLKDESHNPVGTHKDRLSWEIYLFYNEFIKEQIDSGTKLKLPRLSLISSGNAALSIQYLLQLNGLPNLKVLIDPKRIDKILLDAVRKSGCEVYLFDLDKDELYSEDILRLTNNTGGYDITYGDKIENIKFSFYDWLSYEILNLNPQHVFIPYGSGDLYKNIVEICIKELTTVKTAKRFFGNKNILSKCHFFGATTDNPKSQMKMLFAPYNSYRENNLKNVFSGGHIGHKSNIYVVEEKYVKPALSLAKINGITCEPSGVAGLALFLQMRKELPPDDKILIINTGKIKLEIFQ